MGNKRAAGFTLLEMSIVLVIIGVLIGGIMFGRTLLIASRLQTVMTDADSYITAVGNFKQQYQALPGDMANATSLWGTDSISCPTGGGTTGTCNGNADGEIGTVSGQEYEMFRFWQHLYLANMFNKKLTGVATSAGTTGTSIGTNVPSGSIEGSGFSVQWWGTVTASTSFFPGYYGNALFFGGNYNNVNTLGPILTADQAASIDSKIDDGLPATGKVRALESSSPLTPNCSTTSVASTAAYNLTATGNVCSLVFVTSY